mgnify:CR=1 FL=1
MYKFLSFVGWYYIIVTLLWAISTFKDVKLGKEMDSEGMNLDFVVISIIYLVYYYIGGFG